MKNTNQHQNPQVCKYHNLPLILFDQQQNQPICLTCVKEKTDFVSFDQTQKQLEKIKANENQEFQGKQQQLQQLLDSIQQYKQNFINGIDQIIQIIIDEIEKISLSQNQFEQKFEQGNQQNTLDSLNNQLKNQQDYNVKIKIQLKQLLSDFQQKYIKNDHFNQILSGSKEKEKQISVCEMKQEKNQNLGKFQYKLISESGINKSEQCLAFAFNKDNTNLFVGFKSSIKIYDFINGKIGKELQVLSNHKDFVNCFYIMQQSNCFISGSRDQSIIIWKYDENALWVPQQILKEHQHQVTCLSMNKKENFLISGSWDSTIKFWEKENDLWSCQQTLETDKLNYIYAMSLNESENKLIICSQYVFIYIMEIQNDKKWKITQRIQVGECGLRLCFTLKDQFVFQPKTKDYLEIFDYDSKLNQFSKLYQVQNQTCSDNYVLFPCQYIKQLKMLFVKHGEFVNIYRINENKSYELIQTIKYDDSQLFGIVSDDGQYLITRDSASNEIQVRKNQLKND